ncbi:hypothetical protein L9F63_013144, partial [Diploptera punctata]
HKNCNNRNDVYHVSTSNLNKSRNQDVRFGRNDVYHVSTSNLNKSRNQDVRFGRYVAFQTNSSASSSQPISEQSQNPSPQTSTSEHQYSPAAQACRPERVCESGSACS